MMGSLFLGWQLKRYKNIIHSTIKKADIERDWEIRYLERMRGAAPAITKMGSSRLSTKLVKEQLRWKRSHALNVSERYGLGLVSGVTNKFTKESGSANERWVDEGIFTFEVYLMTTTFIVVL